MNIRLISIFVLLFLTAVLYEFHQLGMGGLYWKLWWYDMLMHFLGGIIIGTAYLWVAQFKVSGARSKAFFRYTHVFLFALLVGVAWEIFEYYAGLYPNISPILQQLDIIQDLGFDVLGASFSYLVFSRVVLRYAR